MANEQDPMPTVLLRFLGRVPKSEQGYRATRYDFGDGLAHEPVAFFGWPLQRRVRADRLVVLGTAGSMWDPLFEEGIASGAGGAAPAGSVYWFEDLQGPTDKLAAWADSGLGGAHPNRQRQAEGYNLAWLAAWG